MLQQQFGVPRAIVAVLEGHLDVLDPVESGERTPRLRILFEQRGLRPGRRLRGGQRGREWRRAEPFGVAQRPPQPSQRLEFGLYLGVRAIRRDPRQDGRRTGGELAQDHPG